MLNQTDISYGVKGHNKFYQIQLIERDDGMAWWVFTKWGRVGAASPQSALKPFSRLSEAAKEFEKVFKSKTKNEWEDRGSFDAVEGKYTLIAMDAAGSDAEGMGMGGGEEEEESEEEEPAESALSEELQLLMGLMCNKSLLKETLVELDVDIDKFPLGKLSSEQISVGYDVLRQLQEAITGNGATRDADLVSLSNRFYTSIPHNFGMKLPPSISTLEILKQKIEMLEVLGGIEASRDLLQSTKQLMALNPLDRHYAALKATIEPLSVDDEMMVTIKSMVASTHAETHKGYSMAVKQVYSVEREGEERRFKPFRKLHNRRLLWHGSRLSNLAGILSKGLKIAPTEAPTTGYMFGKGLYFADCVSKSANYCRASRNQPRALLLLCEVAMGDMYPCTSAEYLDQAPHGYHSTTGLGKSGLDASNEVTMESGAVACPGPLIPNPEASSSSLLYNEFIVYDTNQVKIQYMVEVECNFDAPASQGF